MVGLETDGVQADICNQEQLWAGVAVGTLKTDGVQADICNDGYDRGLHWARTSGN